jgi:hypothetical protein
MAHKVRDEIVRLRKLLDETEDPLTISALQGAIYALKWQESLGGAAKEPILAPSKEIAKTTKTS